uniref:Uncharacterized protein n=1 Tax=Pipistrellus kuhlii TaxID=59472 RepID=A0A7J8B2P4_PIPKU|nr:hypothetical protein mPipKuh1_007819 [Pipistrellus kuhlii]
MSGEWRCPLWYLINPLKVLSSPVTRPVLSGTLTPSGLKPPKFQVPQTLNCQFTVTGWAPKRQYGRISDAPSTISLQAVTALSVHSLDSNLGLTLHCSLCHPTSGNQDMSCLLWINAVSATFMLGPPVLSHRAPQSSSWRDLDDLKSPQTQWALCPSHW